MFLSELHVENLGAIRRASVRFDRTTALIGENGCGTAGLLRALDLVLGHARLRRTDFGGAVDGTAGELRIALRFAELQPGDWSTPWHRPLRAVPRPANGMARELVLVATALPRDLDDGLAFAIEGAGAAASRAAVDHVLACCPLLRAGAPAARARGARLRANPDALPPAIAALVARIVGTADALLTGTAEDPEACLDDGAAAARALLAERPEHIDPDGTGLPGAVLEILGGPAAAAGNGARAAAVDGRPAADRLAMLTVVAAVLRELPGGLPRGAAPIWILEDPEAHLHPMTLASAARLFERVHWQKIVTTHSGALLASLPLAQVRRLVRHAGVVGVASLRPRALSRDSLRRIGYHLRLIRGVAMFARVWLLVEGESEFWILPQVANVLGHDLAREGICCVAFAQCGIAPLVRTANEFGIAWHLLADGDDAGERYAAAARTFVRGGDPSLHLTMLREPDIEHCFWEHGHADAIRRVARLAPGRRATATQAIQRAVERHSKPNLALELVQSVAARGPSGVPPPLARLVATCVELARRPPAWIDPPSEGSHDGDHRRPRRRRRRRRRYDVRTEMNP
jgi:putative ATP-dependent endonuclease of OLD family